MAALNPERRIQEPILPEHSRQRRRSADGERRLLRRHRPLELPHFALQMRQRLGLGLRLVQLAARGRSRALEADAVVEGEDEGEDGEGGGRGALAHGGRHASFVQSSRDSHLTSTCES